MDDDGSEPKNSLVSEVKRVPIVDNHYSKQVNQRNLEVVEVEDPVVGLGNASADKLRETPIIGGGHARMDITCPSGVLYHLLLIQSQLVVRFIKAAL